MDYLSLAQLFGPQEAFNPQSLYADRDRLYRERGGGMLAYGNADTGLTDYSPADRGLYNSIERELEKNAYDQHVPQDLRDAIARQSSLAGFGLNDRAMDQFGNPLSFFYSGEDNGSPGSNRVFLPTSVADKYAPQLNPQWVQKDMGGGSWLDKMGDRFMPAIATGMATAGVGSGLSSYFAGIDPSWADAFNNWGGTDVAVEAGNATAGNMDWTRAFDGWSGTDIPLEAGNVGGGNMSLENAFNGWTGTDVPLGNDAPSFDLWGGTDVPIPSDAMPDWAGKYLSTNTFDPSLFSKLNRMFGDRIPGIGGGAGGKIPGIGGDIGGKGGYSFPFADVIGGLLSMYGANKQKDTLKEMLELSINSDLWRNQQPRYFDPLYQATTQGIGNTSYGQGIVNDTTRALAAQGYNMSGNAPHEVAKGLNTGSINYINAVGPLAMGRPTNAGAIANLGGQIAGQQGSLANSLGYLANAIGTGNQPTASQQVFGGQQPNQTLIDVFKGMAPSL